MRINHRYAGVHAMARWLMVTLPPWIPPGGKIGSTGARPGEHVQAWNAIEAGNEAEILRLKPH